MESSDNDDRLFHKFIIFCILFLLILYYSNNSKPFDLLLLKKYCDEIYK